MKKVILSLDFSVIFSVLLLMASGFCAITSATDNTRKLTVQLICYVVGTVLMLCIAFWDYRSIRGQKTLLYAVCILSLAFVLILGIGKEETGAKSWIRFGGIGVQPSEFVKLIFCLYLSCELTEKIEKNILNNKKDLLLTLLKCTPIVALVVMQNDTGTALVFVFFVCAMLFVSGISAKYILISSVIVIISLPFVWLFLADYQRDRLMVFFNPTADLSDSGYQVYLAKLSLASGGILGAGYGQGAVNSLSFLPEKETDFIFSVIGEETGLLGTTIILLLFIILILRCFFVASHAADIQGKLIATGTGAVFLFHTAENIGMTLGLLPVTGIPLPFVSYGGSSVLSMSIGAGLILCVRRKAYNLYHS